MNHRRGMSLIEVLVIITVCGFVLAIAGSILATAMRINGQAHQDTAWHQSRHRLASAWRADARQSKSAVVKKVKEGNADAAAGEQMRFEFPGDQVVAYDLRDDEIRRIEFIHGKPTSIDFFRLPPAYTVAWGSEETAGQRRAILEMAARAGDGSDLQSREHVVKLIGAVGRDLQFRKAEEAQSNE